MHMLQRTRGVLPALRSCTGEVLTEALWMKVESDCNFEKEPHEMKELLRQRMIRKSGRERIIIEKRLVLNIDKV